MSMILKGNSGINFKVDTVDDLLTLEGSEGEVVIVSDENRGGTFIYRSAEAATNNGGTVFNGWCRQYDGAVNVKWFGKGFGNGLIDIYSNDYKGDGIGKKHNYLESTDISSPITNGSIDEAPLSSNNYKGAVEIIPHFYNDFGLESTRASAGGLGSTQWYTWEWNHTLNTTYGDYDAKRHPLLGWYRGDDAKILDWICYWLKESNIQTFIFTNGNMNDISKWSQSTDPKHWMYQMFNNVKNFKAMNYILTMPLSSDLTILNDAMDNIKLIQDENTNFHTIGINGKKYVTLFSYDFGTLRTSGAFASDSVFEAWLKNIADYYIAKGYDGIVILGRNSSAYSKVDSSFERMKNYNVLIFETKYGGFNGTYTGATTYDDYVNMFSDSYDLVKTREIPNVMTSYESKFHPSGWTASGSTPQLFRSVMCKALEKANSNNSIPNIITVYNVSEWGEGGASLQPNHADGFGYLDAVKNAVGSIDNQVLLPSTDISYNIEQSLSRRGIVNNNILKELYVITLDSPLTVGTIELKVTAFERTGNYARISKKYIINYSYGSSAVSISSPIEDSGESSSRTSANYAITPAVTITSSNNTTLSIAITLTSSGAITFSYCNYTAAIKVIDSIGATVEEV